MVKRTSQRLLLLAAAGVVALGGIGLRSSGTNRSSVGVADASPAPLPVADAAVPARPEAALPRGAFAPAFPLGGAVFTEFVADSYRQQDGGRLGGTPGPASFYRWLNSAYAGRTRRLTGPPPGVSAALPLGPALDAERSRLRAIADPGVKAKAQERVGAWVFRTVKKAVPHFSLQNGYEFYNMAEHGQRQCLAQSVLAAGMLQRAGVPAGIVMVWKSNKGEESNNGHCVTVAQLASGRQILVDPSEKKNPFPHHQGLFVAGSGGPYQYVMPVYAGGATGPAEIVAYTDRKGGGRISLDAVRTMDLAFIRSQFDYYRGERAPGGPFARRITPKGLSLAAAHLRTAVSKCPDNPLAVYMLGRVYQRLGRTDLARMQFALAHSKYDRFGYVPEGAAEAFSRSSAAPVQVSRAETRRLD